jgi:hypothetical protein
MNELALAAAWGGRMREASLTMFHRGDWDLSAPTTEQQLAHDPGLARLWSDLCRHGFVVHQAPQMRSLVGEVLSTAIHTAPAQLIDFLKSLDFTLATIVDGRSAPEQLAVLEDAMLAAKIANAPAALLQPMRVRAECLRGRVASARRTKLLEKRERLARERMRGARGIPELEENARHEFAAVVREWKREFLTLARWRGHIGGTLRIRARRPMCSRARRFRRARRTLTSRRAQSDSGGSDGDAPDGDPPSSFLETYAVAPKRRTTERAPAWTALLSQQPQLRKLRRGSAGRGPHSETGCVGLSLGSSASESLLTGAGLRSPKEEAP